MTRFVARVKSLHVWQTFQEWQHQSDAAGLTAGPTKEPSSKRSPVSEVSQNKAQSCSEMLQRQHPRTCTQQYATVMQDMPVLLVISLPLRKYTLVVLRSTEARRAMLKKGALRTLSLSFVSIYQRSLSW